ncbi:MAG: hypothetical protein ABIR57_04415, partial [Aeromicrobium sp.]
MSASKTMTKTATGTRFASWSRAQAIGLVALLLMLLGWGLLAGSNRPEAYRHPDPAKTDAALYTQITERVIGGQSYYRAVDAVQAERGFPTRPFVTVREPALTWVTSRVGGIAVMRIALVALGIAVVATMILRLERIAPGRPTWWFASAMSALAVAPVVTGDAVVIHEVWAGLLLTLALALSTVRLWWIGLAIGFAAVIVRELALPLFAVMIAFEIAKGSYRRAIAWAVGALLFVGLLAIHAANVANDVSPSTAESAGWLKFGGWPFFVDSVRFSTILQDMPEWVAAVVVPLAL